MLNEKYIFNKNTWQWGRESSVNDHFKRYPCGFLFNQNHPPRKTYPSIETVRQYIEPMLILSLSVYFRKEGTSIPSRVFILRRVPSMSDV